MKTIWVYGDRRNAAVFGHTLNVIGGALGLSHKGIAAKVICVLINAPQSQPHTAPEIDLDSAFRQAADAGANEVLVLETRCPATESPRDAARVIHQAVSSTHPDLFLFPLNDHLREIAARSAFLCCSGLIADCVDFKVSGSEIIAVCPSYGGEAMADLGFSDQARTGFITVQPTAFSPVVLKNASIPLTTLEIDLPVQDSGLRLISRTPLEATGKSLETADIVVVGGAGLGNLDGFNLIRKLAASLGGVVGATRPPVLWHWADEDSLVGQTGKTIQPKLLISAGASGAVQYTAGITQSRLIVAVNRDPDAPIFQVADIGIVADATRFIPLLTDSVRKRVMRSLADAMDETKSGPSGSDFGSKLMKIREGLGLSREDLAERSGHTPEFITDIETNRSAPSVGFLIKLSEILDIDPGTFLNQDERRQMTGKRAREYTRRTGNYHYRTLTPGAENEHLRVFEVTIESRQTHKSVAYRHEGEEFVLVMEGKLQLTVGEKNYVLLTGESMKFNSEIPHKLKNISDTDTRCLVTLYTP